MPRRRFVVLEHDHPLLHWDFLLETDDLLQSWRLLQLPEAGLSVVAERLPDHRRVYLDYEGPVSGDRGTVQRVVSGTYDDVGPLKNAIRSLRVFGWPGVGACALKDSADGKLCWTFVE